MNLKAKFVFSIGLLCLMVPSSLRADIVYTYTGTPYTTCFGTYTCNGTTPFLSLTFDTPLTLVQLENLAISSVVGGNLTSHLTSFAITDGNLVSITQTSSLSSFVFDVATDGAGNITKWCLNVVTTGAADAASTTYQYPVAPCGVGDNDDSAHNLLPNTVGSGGFTTGRGLWSPPTSTSSVPEPGAGFLTLIGAGLLLVMRKRIALGL